MTIQPSSSNSFSIGVFVKRCSFFVSCHNAIYCQVSKLLFFSQLSWSYLSSDWSVQFLGAWSLFSWQLFHFTPSYSCFSFEKGVFRFIRGHPKGICPFNNSRIILLILGWHSKVFLNSTFFYARVIVFLLQQDADALHLFFT